MIGEENKAVFSRLLLKSEFVLVFPGYLLFYFVYKCASILFGLVLSPIIIALLNILLTTVALAALVSTNYCLISS